MRTFNIGRIQRAIILFSRNAKMQIPCTAQSLGLSSRAASVFKTVMTRCFYSDNNQPYEFPRLFTCNDERHQLYRKLSTKTDIDLGDVETVRVIAKLMSYVSSCERKKREAGSVSSSVRTDDVSIIHLADIKDIVISRGKGSITLKIIFS